MKTIAVNIEKGGAGKTTIACHLAWHLADAGHRVLVLVGAAVTLGKRQEERLDRKPQPHKQRDRAT